MDRQPKKPTSSSAPAAQVAVAEPAVAEPAVAEPAVAEPAVAEPAVAEPAVAEPAVAEPALHPAKRIQTTPIIFGVYDCRRDKHKEARCALRFFSCS
jgi:hypothetical protein